MKTHTYRIDDLTWAEPAHQERSQRTLQRLLDAAEDEICDKGYADASVVEIARRAGCSVGTVYRRFRDKTALLNALDERWGDAFRTTMEDAVAPERWEGAPILEILAGYIEFSLNQSQEHAALHRAALIMASRDASFAERQMKLAAELHTRLCALLLARRSEIGHPDPTLAIEFTLEQLRSMLVARTGANPRDTTLFAVSDERFLEQALASVSADLELEPELDFERGPRAM
jgi:AcrR family transcriptional regulator